ncbi:hypothetical protein K438DRAFT_1986597 [Mycena galopus ATCC 62051]|nr:hypothetical protein K438DRAFT_1986597 [Mycena galopus ATCC 62051]
MSTLPRTNLSAEEVIMDSRPGGRDSRYYCLPPFRGSPNAPGHIVGVFDDWLETQASMSGYPDNSFRGYHSMAECIEAWQALCRWGIHPHEVDPEYATGADAVVSPSPEESTTALVSPGKSGTIDL